MSEKLARFLIGLAIDPDKQARFDSNPEAGMTDAGLTEEEKAAVRERDSAKIKNLVARTRITVTVPGTELAIGEVVLRPPPKKEGPPKRVPPKKRGQRRVAAPRKRRR
jgi:hypothetical protein